MSGAGNTDENPLSLFHPLIASWFVKTYGNPTDIQRLAWPRIAARDHVLITAPTGSGKTLTAFLWAIDNLISGRWEGGSVRVLYVSPLKALNTDIRKNLLRPIDGLKAEFASHAVPFPEIGVLTRSGDTPENERRRMLRHPPEIFITTPESLNIILSSKNARHMLDGVRVVILDEIHSIAAGKRGTFLMTSVERACLLAGEFQRIAISATVQPLPTVADFVGGFQESDGIYIKRPVTILRSSAEKTYDISVMLPEEGLHAGEEGSVWPVFARDFRAIIARNRSSLFFTNTRRHAEKLTFLLNEGEKREIAYSHHGSLSKEIRRVVEERLKNGELDAIVATSSLELGIDIGELDEVILVETPPTVAAALQRIGRAGHGVGRTSKGTLYPLHGRDLVDAAVMAQAIAAGAIEETRIVEAPLDILAQEIVAMTGVDEWNDDSLFSFIRTVYPFRNLSRKLFDLVLEMLAGRYADSPIRELKARISYDRIDGSIRAVTGALPLIYSSGGTIPDRGSYTLRMQGNGAKIGELDEEFVWERHVGDTFPLGAQHWKITHIDAQNVEVIPQNGTGGILPFWRAESRYRDWSYMDRTGFFLETWNDRLETEEFLQELETGCRMNRSAARETRDFLLSQKQITGKPLPHRHHVLIERHRAMLEQADTEQHIIHTLWGGKINFPASLILALFWKERYGFDPEVYADNDAVIIVVPQTGEDYNVREVFLHAAGEIARGGERETGELIRKTLESTGFFGAKFRENAGRALLLPRGGLGKRTPLWLTRLRSKRLLDSVMKYEDFPILIETWRSCFQDELDLRSLTEILGEVRRGEIVLSQTETLIPSPFARHLIWMNTNTYVYENDVPLSSRGSSLSGDIIREAVFTPHLRPRITPEIASAFDAKLKRTIRGYAPESVRETVDWVKERLYLPEEEWFSLLAQIRMDSPELFNDTETGPEGSVNGTGGMSFADDAASRLVYVTLPGAAGPGIMALETMPRVFALLGIGNEDSRTIVRPLNGSSSGNPELPDSVREEISSFNNRHTSGDDDPIRTGEIDTGRFLTEWLRFYSPITVRKVSELTGIPRQNLEEIFESLAEDENIILDYLTEGADDIQVCDPDNLESLLRISRAGRRAVFSPHAPEYLQPFLAGMQGVTAVTDESNDDLRSVLETLFGYAAGAELWETDIFPSRLSPYYTAWLDAIFQENDVMWFGAGKNKVGFCFREDYELFHEHGETQSENREVLLEQLENRRTIHDLAVETGMKIEELREALWNAVWAGEITTDSFETVRRGMPDGAGIRKTEKPAGETELPGNKPDDTTRFGSFTAYRAGLRKHGRWTASRVHEESWFRIDRGNQDYDAIEREELVRERIRQVLLRYGVVFRQILEYELPFMKWNSLWRSLRLMELSGEILSGRFFEGISGIQFASHEAFRKLMDFMERSEDIAKRIYFINAQDPASLCGMGIEDLPWKLPPRLASTHLVFKGSSLVLVSKRLAKELEFLVPPNDPEIPDYLFFLNTLAFRKVSPVTVRIETVNGEPVRTSPYAERLIESGLSRDYKAFHLRGRIKVRDSER